MTFSKYRWQFFHSMLHFYLFSNPDLQPTSPYHPVPCTPFEQACTVQACVISRRILCGFASFVVPNITHTVFVFVKAHVYNFFSSSFLLTSWISSVRSCSIILQVPSALRPSWILIACFQSLSFYIPWRCSAHIFIYSWIHILYLMKCAPYTNIFQFRVQVPHFCSPST